MLNSRPAIRSSTVIRRLGVVLVLLGLAAVLQFSPTAPPAAAQSARHWVESDDALVTPSGSWTVQTSARASGGRYLYSSGPDDALALDFAGAYLEVVYVAYASFGTLAIEIDQQVYRTLPTHSAEPGVLVQSAVIDYLEDKTHSVRVYGVNGPIAIDAFAVSALPAKPPLQPTRLTGWLTMAYGDPAPGSGLPGRHVVTFTDRQGVQYVLQNVDLRTAQTLQGQWVEVAGVRSAAPDAAIEVALVRPSPDGDASALRDPVTGAQPWVSLLCKFSDIATEPHPASFYPPLFASTYPSLNHYWQQLSYNQMNIDGTMVINQWVTLPQPRSFYIVNNVANLNALMNDCTAAANALVFYPSYVGINMMFNATLDCCAWGGGATLNLDGQVKSYRVTWLPPWAQAHDVMAHEMGHGFGFPHSSGPADNPPDGLSIYVSQWDMMSASGGTCAVQITNFGCIAPGTIAYHARMDEWIAAGQVRYVNTGQEATVTLERLLVPQSGNYLLARVPINNSSTNFYTVEVRDPAAGYDQNIPGKAVIIHKVNTNNQTNAGHALVVDAADGNDNVNDAGAMWLPGETFTDAANNITIAVLSSSGSTYTVQIANNPGSPVIYAPEGTINDGDPAYQWPAIGDATWYNLVVIDNSTGGIIYNQWHDGAVICSGGACIVPRGAILGHNGAYQWRVQGWGPTIGYSAWDGPHHFNLNLPPPAAATLIYPSGDTGGANHLTYWWTKQAHATWYHVWIGRSNGQPVWDYWYRAKELFCNDQVGQCYIQPNLYLTTGAYQWYVQDWGPGGFGPWSNGANFTVVVSPPPTAPVLLAPGGTTGDNTPTYTWNPALGATQYRLYVSGPLIIDQTYSAGNFCSGNTCAVTPNLVQPNGNYTFWVQGLNSFGGGPWSSGKTFTVTTPPIPPVVQTGPQGTLNNGRPAFTWQHQPLANWYHVWAGTTAGTTWVDAWYEVGVVCSAGNCAAPSPLLLYPGNYQWWIQPWSASVGYGLWSGAQYFTIAPTGFNSQFNGDATGWTVHWGAWWVDNNFLYTNPAAANSWSSVSYDLNAYSNFDYRAWFWRYGCNTCSNAIIVRGNPAPLGNARQWSTAYIFNYSRNGGFSVWRWNSNGTETALQNWAGTAAINQGDAWNELRVVASGSTFWFYINGTLVWTGSDSAFTVGRVGLGLYRNAEAGDLFIDSAVLSTGSGGVELATTVSAAQQALNDAANRAPAGSALQAPVFNHRAGTPYVGTPYSVSVSPPTPQGPSRRLE